MHFLCLLFLLLAAYVRGSVDILRAAQLSDASYYDVETAKLQRPDLAPLLLDQVPGFPRQVSSSSPAHVWLFASTRTLAIAFRGTASYANVVADMDVFTVSLSGSDTEVRVHSGFLEEYVALEAELAEIIGSVFDQFDHIEFAGHSLGGAIATIAGASVGVLFPSKTVAVYTIGSPRVGNEAFAAWFRSRVTTSVRWTNAEDPVPRACPIGPWFVHVHDAEAVDSNLQVETVPDTRGNERLMDTFLHWDRASVLFGHSADLYVERLLQLLTFAQV